MNRQPYSASLLNLPCPNFPFRPTPVPTTIHRHMAGILTQWAFHRVKEHPKQSSDEGVMTFRSLRSHMNRQPYPSLPNLPCPNSPFRPAPVPTSLHRYMDEILTQWDFHRAQEHVKRSSDKEVMTFRSWRSHMNWQPYLASLLDLPDLPFPDSSTAHCTPQAYGWNLDSMGFP